MIESNLLRSNGFRWDSTWARAVVPPPNTTNAVELSSAARLKKNSNPLLRNKCRRRWNDEMLDYAHRRLPVDFFFRYFFCFLSFLGAKDLDGVDNAAQFGLR